MPHDHFDINGKAIYALTELIFYEGEGYERTKKVQISVPLVVIELATPVCETVRLKDQPPG